jgi:hypothetical protein
VRRTLHLCVVVSLLASFAQAPLQHAHASDPHHKHARGIAHVHWKSLSEDGSWKADDHGSDARMIDWLAGDGKVPAKLAVALPNSLVEVVLVPQRIQILELRPRNHDPPSQLIPYLRGPPA